jgi:prepilin-type N-terminal cleavage/methylation domain-containing protein/prepilin-type processing-associated H-X9-DG protein
VVFQIGETMTRAQQQAFTLIELLVVITIIGILASLLLPALARAKAAARATECRNNLRTMALAMRLYVDDYNAYPPTVGVGTLGFGEKYGWLMADDWKMLLVPFMGVKDDDFPDREDTMRVLRCPQLVANKDGKRGQGQYGMNASGTAPFKDPANLGLGGFSQGSSWNVQPTRESSVRAPANLVAVGDIMPGFTLGEMFWTSGRFDPCSTESQCWPGTSHGGGTANMLFADGHVESGRQTNWVAATEAARRRWNNDNEPHPETWKRP